MDVGPEIVERGLQIGLHNCTGAKLYVYQNERYSAVITVFCMVLLILPCSLCSTIQLLLFSTSRSLTGFGELYGYKA